MLLVLTFSCSGLVKVVRALVVVETSISVSVNTGGRVVCRLLDPDNLLLHLFVSLYAEY